MTVMEMLALIAVAIVLATTIVLVAIETIAYFSQVKEYKRIQKELDDTIVEDVVGGCDLSETPPPRTCSNLNADKYAPKPIVPNVVKKILNNEWYIADSE